MSFSFMSVFAAVYIYMYVYPLSGLSTIQHNTMQCNAIQYNTKPEKDQKKNFHS